MGKAGLQREMDSFLRETENEQFNIRRITKSGFSRSRRKLAPKAFLELNGIIWRDFYEEVDFYGYLKGSQMGQEVSERTKTAVSAPLE